jgi:hypothetical protein
MKAKFSDVRVVGIFINQKMGAGAIKLSNIKFR